MINNVYDEKEFFDEYKKTRESELSYNNLLEQPAMKKLLPDLKNKKILDIGCGAGFNCKDFIAKGANFCLGIDISKNMLNLAKKNNSDKNIKYKNISIENLDKIVDKFDFIYSSLAFHYVENFDKMFFDIKNLLKENGELLFSIENPLKVASMKGSNWHKNDAGVSVFYELSDYLSEGKRIAKWLDYDVVKYHHTFSTIINCMAKNGFIIEKMEEPLPANEAIKKNPKLSREYHAPCFLIIKAKLV